MSVQDLSVYALLLAGVIFSISSNKLTIFGAVTGFFIGLFIYKGAGFFGLSMLILFFLLGSFATKLFLKKKQLLGIAESDNGRRTAGQVIANGGVAAILGAIAWSFPRHSALIQLMIGGSVASATADTLSSELGSVYGSRFYDILSFRKVNPGPDGVISLEGTLIGMAGAALIAITYAIGIGFNYQMLIVIVAGVIGNLTDSLLGATLERRNLIRNNTVNFLNTSMGAAICWTLYALLNS